MRTPGSTARMRGRRSIILRSLVGLTSPCVFRRSSRSVRSSACAVFANALVGTAVFVLVLVEAVAAARDGSRAVRRVAARVAVFGACVVGVFMLGYLSYLAILGSINPMNLLRPTIEFFGENNRQ